MSELFGVPLIFYPYSKAGCLDKIRQIIIKVFQIVALIGLGFVGGCIYGASQ